MSAIVQIEPVATGPQKTPMLKTMKTLKVFIYSFLLAPSFAFAQSIDFTFIPPLGSFEYLRGQVRGVDPTKYGIAVVIDVFGTSWTKPYFNQPISPISSDGTFDIPIVTGGQDACAQGIWAGAVPLDYPIPLISGGNG